MHIYYEQNFFRSNSKEELIGFTEFLSNTGGLLGLFLGFSVVSIIEIFYFLTFRPYCARNQHRGNEKISANVHREGRKRLRRAIKLEGNVHFKRSKVVGQIKGKELALFRPEVCETSYESAGINRYQYFD